MNGKAVMGAMAALVLVSGCNGDSTETTDGNGAAGAGPAAPAEGSPVTRDALVGTWGQNDCTNTMTLAADGTATSMTAEQGNNRWTLDGSTIVIASPGEPDVRMPATMSNGELHISGGGGEGQSTVFTRCETAADAAGASPDGENEAVGESAE